MRYRRTIWVASALLLASVVEAKAQYYGATAANFLNYPATPQALAMGEAGVSLVTRSAMSIIANPGLLGMQSLENNLNVGTSLQYSENYSFLASGVSYGPRLNSIWHELPFKAGIGVGYSYEELTFPFSAGGAPIGGTITDYANSFTVGMGIDYFLRLGLGYSVELIKNTHPAFTPNIDQPAANFGADLQVPVLHLLYGTQNRSALIGKNIYPSLDVTAGYALRNVGGYVIKTPTYQLPLARQANLGWNWEFVLMSRVAGFDWKWFSFTWAREAMDEPFKVDSVFVGGASYVSNRDSVVSYRNGPGSFSPWNDLIMGRPVAIAQLSKGWQIGLGGFLYLQGGSITYPGGPTAITSGWEMKLDGFLRSLVFFHVLSPNGSVTHFLLRNLDLQFDYSASNAGGGISPLESLNLTLR